jgi:hypothetical protein
MDYTVVAVLLALGLGFVLGLVVFTVRKKLWYLETMNPREMYVLGREKTLIVNLNIVKRQFNGFEAGKYKVLLMWGDIASFSKHIFYGKIEEMYFALLAESMYARNMLTRIEKLRFFDFLHRHIPTLSTKAFMITGELISPQDVLDLYWTGDERDKALSEMKKRGLINPKVLWVKPYPPEKELKEILLGLRTIPDYVQAHEEDYTRLAGVQRKVLVEFDSSTANLLSQVVPLMRNIVDSISDPTVVLGMFLADRAKQLEGLGLDQLAERGGMESVLAVAERLKQYKDAFLKSLGESTTPEQAAKMEAMMKKYQDMESKLAELEKKLVQSQKTEATAAVSTQPPKAK